MDQGDVNTEESSAHSELAALYSEACQSFVLRDFDSTSSIVNRLLEDIEQDSLGLSDDYSQSDITELVRRVWILYITLLASADDVLARDPKKAEQALDHSLSRIESFYGRALARNVEAPSTSTISPSTLSPTLIHPSILVAFSLAGLKLDAPQLVRRTLQDHFKLLLHRAAEVDSHLSSSHDDISNLDISHADLSLSGIALNGHGPNSHVNGHSANEDAITTSGPSGSGLSSARIKSLHRLSRIYSIHLLCKTLGEWSSARVWIREMQHNDAAAVAGLMSDSYAQVREGLLNLLCHALGMQLISPLYDRQTLLDTLEEVKAEVEQEEVQARQAAKAEKERQAEIAKRSRSESRRQERSSPSAVASSSQTNKAGTANALPPQHQTATFSSSSERLSSQSQRASETGRTVTQHSTGSETGFAAFRSHLSSFLSSDPSRSTSSTSNSLSSRRHPHDQLSHSSTTSLDLIKLYLSRMINSRLLKVLLAFFIITGFWRRRLARSGRKLEIGQTWKKLKKKVVDTVKMGGSLGFL